LGDQVGDQVVEVEAGGAAFAPRGNAHTYQRNGLSAPAVGMEGGGSREVPGTARTGQACWSGLVLAPGEA
jgi:hypothetical protein